MEFKKMKPPLTYYGGKQTLAPLIISLIPEHVLYGEPFTGGGAVFFHKKPSKTEVLNDTNGELMNFYKVTRDNFEPLQSMIRETLHSREAFRHAEIIYHNTDMFDPVTRAWAVWTICAQSFAAKMDGPFGFDNFTDEYARRLEKVQIECADALYVIQSRDFEEAFFYCDPPYVGSNCGHYKGYTEADYDALLSLLSRIKGKFLLSSYPSDILKTYSAENNWHSIQREFFVTVNAKSGNQKRKVEMLTANYPLIL